jgi:hypothetical protein
MPRRKLTYVSASVKRNIVNTNVYKTDSSRPGTRTFAGSRDCNQRCVAVFGTGGFDSLNAQGERLIRQVTVAFMILRLEICDWNIYLPTSGGEPNCSIPVNYNVTHIVNSMVEYQKGACTFLAD